MPECRLENPLLTPVFDQIGVLVDYTHISIYVVEGSDVTLVAYRGPVPVSEASLFSFPLARAGGARQVISSQAPLLIADARGGTAMAQSFLEATRDVPENTFDYIGSWIGLPLWIGGKVAGMLDLAHAQRGRYGEEELARVAAYVQQVAVLIENAVLYADLSQRSQELQTLFAVQQAINSHLDVSIVLQMVADQARRLTSARQILVFLAERDRLWAAYQSGQPALELPPGYSLSLEGSMIGRTLASGHLLRVFDTRTDPRVDRDTCRLLDARSLLVVPLGPSDRPIGALVATNKVFGAFGPRDERVLSQLASGAAIAMENARLYRDQWEARRTAEGLQEILALVGSGRPLEAILDGVLGTAVGLLGADAGALYLPSGPDGLATLQAARGFDAELAEAGRQPFDWRRRLGVEGLGDLPAAAGKSDGPAPVQADPAAPPARDAGPRELAVRRVDLARRRPGGDAGGSPAAGDRRTVDPGRAGPETAEVEHGGAPGQPGHTPPSDAGTGLLARLALRFATALLVPLAIQGEPAGLLEFYYGGQRSPAPGAVRLAETVGRHAAYAVERGRLAEKADELVRLQERRRIAQTLHDTVAQMLFRMGIEAEWCGQHLPDDDAVAQRIELVRRLVARSSYELRSAIFALRDRDPAGDNSLVALLRDLVQEFQQETGIRATLIAAPELGPLPPAAAEALYRIVREALSNVRKHAQAGAVIVGLHREPEAVALTVQDNGIGLDEAVLVDSVVGGLHFGVNSMRLLARQLGGRFYIGNNDEQGTMVKVHLPLAVPEGA